MAAIEISGARKVFHNRASGTDLVTLEGIDLSVASNDFLCLLGPSGCGKSTLLNIIAGFDMPSGGTVTVDGKLVSGPGAERGMVFQQPTLMPWLPVWENVAFHLRLKGMRRRARRAAAKTFIDMVGLTGFENHYPAQLSGGMSQRVGIARALLMNPRVILMDEPFGALDEQTKMEMQIELVRIWEQHRGTIVFVTHGIDEAITLGTHIAVMSARPGRIKALLPIDLPRPRDVTSPRFNDYKRYLLSVLRGEDAVYPLLPVPVPVPA